MVLAAIFSDVVPVTKPNGLTISWRIVSHVVVGILGHLGFHFLNTLLIVLGQLNVLIPQLLDHPFLSDDDCLSLCFGHPVKEFCYVLIFELYVVHYDIPLAVHQASTAVSSSASVYGLLTVTMSVSPSYSICRKLVIDLSDLT